MLHPDLSHMQGYTKTQNKGMEEDLPTKWREVKKKQELQFSSLIKWPLSNKDQKKQRRTLHNGKTINATRRANDPKYIHTQYRSTQIHKASA